MNKSLILTTISLGTFIVALLLLLNSDILTFSEIDILPKEVVDMSVPLDVSINLKDLRK